MITPRVNFTCEEARQSLETSLRELKSDHLDLFLLHEVSADVLIGNLPSEVNIIMTSHAVKRPCGRVRAKKLMDF
jgi:aryl-alcohol dehydrogenase-like predicted oxidoreductase